MYAVRRVSVGFAIKNPGTMYSVQRVFDPGFSSTGGASSNILSVEGALPPDTSSYLASAVKSEALVKSLRKRLTTLRNSVGDNVERDDMLDALRRENLSLLDEVNDLKNRLRVLLDSTTPPLPSSEERKNSKTGGKDTVEKPKQPRKEKTKKAAKAPKNQPAPVAIHRLDLRVAKILSAKPHGEKLYLEDVDVGEAKKRTVLSGLQEFIPLDEMQNRNVMLLCNLKPRPLAGILSEAMVMCAKSGDKVELVEPPEGSVPGDRIIVEGHEGEPDPELKPKKKIFEKLVPDIKTNGERVACFKGLPFVVKGKGPCKSQTLENAPIS